MLDFVKLASGSSRTLEMTIVSVKEIAKTYLHTHVKCV